MRVVLIDWILQLGKTFSLGTPCIERAVEILDDELRCRPVPRATLHLYAEWSRSVMLRSECSWAIPPFSATCRRADFDASEVDAACRRVASRDINAFEVDHELKRLMTSSLPTEGLSMLHTKERVATLVGVVCAEAQPSVCA